MKLRRGVALLLALPAALMAQTAEIDVLKLLPAAEVQKYVKGSTVVGKRSEARIAYRVTYADEKYPAIPLITIQVRQEKNAAEALKAMVANEEKFAGLKATPLGGVGDEAFREDTLGRVFFRKGDKVGYVSGKGVPGIEIQTVELTKALLAKL
jgi:hypothetical protein